MIRTNILATIFPLLFLIFCRPVDNKIVIIYDFQTASLDPHLRKEIVTISILGNIYETLVAFNRDMKMIPCLAEYWEKEDSLTWRFYLRKNAKFHNHKDLHSGDVIYSLYRAFNLMESEYSGLKRFIDTIIAEDTKKIVIKLNSPNSFFLYELSDIFIIPEGLDPSTSPPCGTGPYKLKNLDEENIKMVEFAEYWDKKVTIREVNFKFIPEVEKRIEALKNGKADIITFIPLTYLKDLKSAGSVVATPGVATRYLEMDLRSFPFNRREFRLALNLGLNREELINNAYFGYATPANQYIPQGIWGYDYTLPPFEYNPDSARKLLKGLGKLPEIEFDFAEPRAFIARPIIEDLMKLGLRIKVNSLSADKYWEKIERGKSKFYLIGSIPTTTEGVSTLQSRFHSNEPKKGMGILNSTGYSNKTLDSIIEGMFSISSLQDCEKLIRQAQKILILDLPKIPLVWEKEIYGVSKRLDWTPRLDERILVKEMKIK